MKLSTSLLAASFTGFASAFITNSPNRFSSGALAAVKKSTAEADEDVAIEYSIAIPFLERPPLLDGSMAGDVGFDPLGFAREEVSHSETYICVSTGNCWYIHLGLLIYQIDEECTTTTKKPSHH